MDAVTGEVAELNGRIDIQSQIGQGTTFTITLPVPSQVKNEQDRFKAILPRL